MKDESLRDNEIVSKKKKDVDAEYAMTCRM